MEAAEEAVRDEMETIAGVLERVAALEPQVMQRQMGRCGTTAGFDITAKPVASYMAPCVCSVQGD